MTGQVFDALRHDRENPSPWLAIYLDDSIPLNDEAKTALILNMRSRCRQFLLPVLRPLARLLIIMFQLLKIVLPNQMSAPRFMHKLIYWGLKIFALPEANLVILRHFHIGTEILRFIADNVEDVEIGSHPLRPTSLKDLQDNTFVQHDINLYNFVIDLNRELRQQGRQLSAPATLNFDAITDGPMPIDPLPNRWHNFVDVQTAVEMYTPIYQLFLSDDDFWRASNSLQLDETIGLYVATILGEQADPKALCLINNKHPLIPDCTVDAARRLMLHGLAAEALHGMLVRLKRQASSQ